MSEKRFVLDKLYYAIMTPIEKISVGRSYMTYGEVVDCLNELFEENEQLQQELQGMDELICGCCKHFHLGVRDRCDKNNNWILKDGSCQDFER